MYPEVEAIKVSPFPSGDGYFNAILPLPGSLEAD